MLIDDPRPARRARGQRARRARVAADLGDGGDEVRRGARRSRRELVSGFSADWLALREPFDAAARTSALVAELRAHLPRGTPLEILDLGCGAGSNLRHLAPLLGGPQRWRLADHDATLLQAALATTHAWADERGCDVKRAGLALTIARRRPRVHRCVRARRSRRARRRRSAAGRPRHGGRAARPRLAALARRPGAALPRGARRRLDRVDVRRPYDRHAGRTRGRGGARALQSSSARRQGFRPGARSAGGGRRASRVRCERLRAAHRTRATG